MKIHGFNTGRLYQRDGQRISWAIAEDGNVLFNDHSRGINGRFRNQPLEWEEVDPQWIMREYDHNRYDFDPRADRVKGH